jgi:multidrug resistance efflux pump
MSDNVQEHRSTSSGATRTAEAHPAPPAASTWTPRPIGIAGGVVAAAIGLAGMLTILYAWNLWPFDSGIEYTEDAFVRGNTTVISPQVSGYVTAVQVNDYDQVTTGQSLVTIDDRIYRQKVDQAKAALDQAIANLDNSYQAQRSREADLGAKEATIASAQAQLVRAEADMRRVADLVRDGSVSVRERDQTQAALRQARAAVDEAEATRRIAIEDIRTVVVGREGLTAAVEFSKAQLASVQIDLEHTVILAPQAGQLSEIGVRNGQYVTNGTQLLFLVPPHPWVIANYKEAQTARIHVGQTVTFTVDALAGAQVKGHVENLAPAAGSEFTILKPDNATGNFTKVPQRISVRISVDPEQPFAPGLRPGMSVEVSTDTRGGP